MFVLAMLPLSSMQTHTTVPDERAEARPDEIIVTGMSLAKWRTELEDCLARQCPPNEDAEASVHYASMLFVNGRDKDAWKVIDASLDRNRTFAREYPRAVASLYRSGARLAVNLGEPDYARSYGYSIVRSLKAGLPDDARDVLIAEIEVADIAVRADRRDAPRDALRQLRGVERRAREAGEPLVAAMADLRRAMILRELGSSREARELLQPIGADTRDELKPAKRAALALLFQIERGFGNDADADALIGQLRSIPRQQPILLRGGLANHPHAGLRSRSFLTSHISVGDWGDMVEDSATLRLPPHLGDRWADFGFWIRSDGRVMDVEILRGSQLDGWTKPIVQQVGDRLYAPFAGDVGPGQYRIEHYRLTSDLVETTGTLIRRRSPEVRYEMVDLTDPQVSGIEAARID